MAADLGGVVQWRLGVRCLEMDPRRRRTPSGVMVASMVECPVKVEASIFALKMDLWNDGGDDICECVRPVCAPDPVCGSAGASGF